MVNIYNIKEKKYRHFENKVYFVVMNNVVTTEKINSYIKARKNPTPANIILLNLNDFKKCISKFSRLEVSNQD